MAEKKKRKTYYNEDEIVVLKEAGEFVIVKTLDKPNTQAEVLLESGEVKAVKFWEIKKKQQDKKPKIRGFQIVADQHRKFPFKQIQKPIRADKGSCAYDFFSPVDAVIKPNEQMLIFSDIKAFMQQDEVLILNVRSSQGKIRIQFANTQGWIDSTYYSNPSNDGNCGLFLRNEGTEDYVIKAGDRVAQGMFIKYLVTDDDNVLNEVRSGGFGSSGK